MFFIDRFGNLCYLSDTFSPQNFGINPVFLPDSSLFDQKYISSLAAANNITATPTFSNLKNFGFAFGFNETPGVKNDIFFLQITILYSRSLLFFLIFQSNESNIFQFFLDVNMGYSDVNKLLTYMSDGYFFDEFTAMVCVRLVTYNGQSLKLQLFFSNFSR